MPKDMLSKMVYVLNTILKKANGEYPTVSVVVPTFNGENRIKKCIDAILTSNYSNLLEIIVIDDKSTDKTAEIASTLPVKLIKRSENNGKPVANNEGYRHAKGEIVLFIDDDTVLTPDCIRNMMINYQRNDAIAGVGGIGLSDSDNLTTAYAQSMSVLYLLYAANRKVEITKEKFVILPSYLVSYRRKVIEEVGGFDEDLLAASEDRDLEWRILKKGYKLIFDPSASAIHYSWAPNFRTKFKKNFRNAKHRILFLRKHPDYPHVPLKKYILNILRLIILLGVFGYFLFISTSISLFIIPIPFMMLYFFLLLKWYRKSKRLSFKIKKRQFLCFPLLSILMNLAWTLGSIKGLLKYS